MPYCKECKEYVPEGFEFCPNCGVKVTETCRTNPRYCQKCNEILPEGCNFCPHCGGNSQGTPYCAHCKKILPEGFEFCPTCGTRIAAERYVGPVEHVGMFTALKKYAQFSGRARRQEYWLWVLFCFLISQPTYFIRLFSVYLDPDVETFFDIIDGGITLAFFLPSLAVLVRRLHDTGRSGWNCLWLFLPMIIITYIYCFSVDVWSYNSSTMVFQQLLFVYVLFCPFLIVSFVLWLVWCCQRSQRGTNKYGPNPCGY